MTQGSLEGRPSTTSQPRANTTSFQPADMSKLYYEGHLKSPATQLLSATVANDLQSNSAEPVTTTTPRSSPRNNLVGLTTTPKATEQTGGLQKIGNMIDNTFDEVKEFLGFGPKCQNGGIMNPTSKICACRKYFVGRLCETKVCFNGGALEKTGFKPIKYECRCPYPKYVEGVHCEKVTCQNEGVLAKHENGSSTCDCSELTFFKGRFCEEFQAPYGAIAVPLCLLLLFVILCVICRMDLCPRSRRGRNNRAARSRSARPRAPSDEEIGRRVGPGPYHTRRTPHERINNPDRQNGRERLLNDTHHTAAAHRLNAGRRAYAPDVVAPYVIRLDTIPTFNPNMIGGVEPEADSNKLDPPPTYEQALRHAAALPRPPRYTRNENENRDNPDQDAPSSQPPPPSN